MKMAQVIPLKVYPFTLGKPCCVHFSCFKRNIPVKILKIGTPIIITIIVLQLGQLDFTVRYCVQKMQTE